MQTISTPLQQAIAATTVYPSQRVIAEWNYNRFIEGITVTNAAGGDNEVWPLDSLIAFRYGKSGIYRAIVGEALALSKKANNQYRAVSPDDAYKYWRSPNASSSTGALTGCNPVVSYNKAIRVNKIVVGFEVGPNFTPTAVTVRVIKADGTKTTAGAATPNADGKIIYYFTGTGWSSTYQIGNYTDITGIEVSVTAMNKAGAYCHMNEISARWITDISPDVESVDVGKIYEMDDSVLPVGSVASNNCSILLANDDGRFDPENTLSPFYGLLGENVRFEVAIGYDTTKFGGAGIEYIPQGVFWSDSWSYNSSEVSVDVQCTDSSKILQQEYAPQSLFKTREDPEDRTEGMLAVNHVVRELLGSVGFNDILFMSRPTIRIPYVWYDGEVTVWEALSDIARAVPAAFYFDEQGRFVWRDGFNLYAKTTPDYSIDSDVDLISLSTDYERAANHATVRYNVYGVNRRDDVVLYSDLWSPDGTVTLRVGEIDGNFTDTATRIKLSMSDEEFETWPATGIVRVNNERIRYGAKTQNTDPNEPNYTTTNHPSLLELERGVLGTSKGSHEVGVTGGSYTMRITQKVSASIQDGYLRMANPYNTNYKGHHYRMFGTLDTRERFYSTKISFTDPCQHNIGGLTIHQHGFGKGIHFELTPTVFATKYGHGEARIYWIDQEGKRTDLMFGPNGMRGKRFNVVRGNWYTIEVEVFGYQYSMYVNGTLVGSAELNMGDAYSKGQFGPYLRGHSVANIEYLLAGKSTDASRIDLYQKGGTTKLDSTFSNYQTSKSTNFFEFGNLVHEVREFKVEYDIFPALIGTVVNTNELESAIFGREFGPFKGRFYAENHARTAAVLNGSDASSSQGEIDHTLKVSGLAIVRQSEEVKEVSNKESIRRLGKQDIEISTPWIESEDDAVRVASFIVDHWSQPVDNLTVEFFPNPSLQVGDLVSINFPEKKFNPETHRYYVIGIDQSIAGESYSSSLTLRRKR